MGGTASFELVVRAMDGSLHSLRLQAADASAAAAEAGQGGQQVLRCEPARARQRKRASGTSAAKLDTGGFALELASLLAAGLSVVQALRALAANEPVAVRRRTLLELVARLSEGLSLSAAMARSPGSFAPLLVATVTASEHTGDLATALQRYAQYLGSFRALRDKVISAAVYPLLLLAVGAIVVLFLLIGVVPKFASLIDSTRAELPWTSQLLMAWGRFVGSHPWVVATIGGGVLLAGLAGVRQTLRSGARARWVERLPVIGASVRQFRHAQLYRTTGMLVRGGIAASRALQMGAQLLGGDDQLRLLGAIGLIREGRSISQALAATGLADSVAVSMLAVAEKTGALADTLEHVAQFHESRLQRSIELTSRLFEPVLMIVIGLVIGTIVLMMYLPIFDLAASLQ